VVGLHVLELLNKVRAPLVIPALADCQKCPDNRADFEVVSASIAKVSLECVKVHEVIKEQTHILSEHLNITAAKEEPERSALPGLQVAAAVLGVAGFALGFCVRGQGSSKQVARKRPARTRSSKSPLVAKDGSSSSSGSELHAARAAAAKIQ
jgi:hypothetical protein